MSDEAAVVSPREAIQAQLDKLQITLDSEIPYRLETVFAKTTGWGAKREIKRRGKLIRQIEPVFQKGKIRGAVETVSSLNLLSSLISTNDLGQPKPRFRLLRCGRPLSQFLQRNDFKRSATKLSSIRP